MILLDENIFSFLGLLFDTPRTPEMTVTLAGPSDLSRFSFDSPRLSPRELDSSSLSLSDFFSFLLFFRDLDLLLLRLRFSFFTFFSLSSLSRSRSPWGSPRSRLSRSLLSLSLDLLLERLRLLLLSPSLLS